MIPSLIDIMTKSEHVSSHNHTYLEISGSFFYLISSNVSALLQMTLVPNICSSCTFFGIKDYCAYCSSKQLPVIEYNFESIRAIFDTLFCQDFVLYSFGCFVATF